MLIEAYYIFAIVAVIGAAIGSYVDLKELWIPDSVNYFMIAFGLTGHAIISILNSNPYPILFSFIAFSILWAIGYVTSHFGVWGGGDAKMLMGFGALLATFPTVAIWPFLITVIFNAIFAGFVISLITMTYLILINFSRFKTEFKSNLNKYKILLFLASLTLILPLIGILLKNLFIAYIGIVVFPAALLLLTAKSIENISLHKLISPSKLMEGDWILDEIKIKDFNYVPKRSGVTKSELEKLKSLEAAGEIKTINVKFGFPLGPGILAGLIIGLTLGDIMVKVFSFLI